MLFKILIRIWSNSTWKKNLNSKATSEYKKKGFVLKALTLTLQSELFIDVLSLQGLMSAVYLNWGVYSCSSSYLQEVQVSVLCQVHRGAVR